MSPKPLFAAFIALTFIALGAVPSQAQTAVLRGRIELKKEGGNTPVQGLVVEVFRTDVKSKFPTATSDRRGNFTFAGIPVTGSYVLLVSGTGISPELVPNIRPGMEDLVIVVREGDGRRPTDEEVRTRLDSLNNAPEEESDEAKKARAEFEAKKKEVEERNKKVEETNQIVTRSLEEGSKAFEARDFSTAIAKFQEGIDADPMFAGSAPVLLNNKAISLDGRAKESYNASVKDVANRATLRASAKTDWENAIAAVEQSLEIVKTADISDENIKKSLESNRLQALSIRKSIYRLMAETGIEISKGQLAATAFAEYLAAETDAAKKTRAQLELAQTLQNSQEYQMAFDEFQKIETADPNNVDALVGMGLNLFTIGYLTQETDAAKGKEQLQEAANYLQRYVDVAPDGHRFKEDAKATLEQLKQDAKVVPQRTTPTRTAPRRRN